jgi:hypothetical protein
VRVSTLVPLGRSGKLRRTWQVQGGGRGSSWLARGGRTDGGERARPSARAVSLQQGAPLFAPHGRAAVAAAARRPARRPAGRGRRAPPGDGWPSYPSLRADALYHEGLALMRSSGTDVSSVTGARNTGRGRIASSTAPLSARAVSLQQGAPLIAPHGRAAVAAAARRPARRPAGRGRRAPPGDGWTVGMKMRSFVLKGPSVRKKMRAPIFEICPLILFQVFCFRSKPCDSVLVQVASTGTDVSSVTGARNTGRGRIASSTAPT